MPKGRERRSCGDRSMIAGEEVSSGTGACADVSVSASAIVMEYGFKESMWVGKVVSSHLERSWSSDAWLLLVHRLGGRHVLASSGSWEVFLSWVAKSNWLTGREGAVCGRGERRIFAVFRWARLSDAFKTPTPVGSPCSCRQVEPDCYRWPLSSLHQCLEVFITILSEAAMVQETCTECTVATTDCISVSCRNWWIRYAQYRSISRAVAKHTTP